MAKKTTRKSARPAPRKAKKTQKKAGALSRGMKTPSSVTTGRGPGPAQVGADLVAMFNQGLMSEVEAKWHSPDIVSIEGVGVAMAWHGKKSVREKSEQWAATHRIHGASAEGPYLGATGFAVKFALDIEDTTANTRAMMEEVGVYIVQNGKIVREEFMYGKVTPISADGGPQA
jgi:hypothetical protein